MKQRNKISEDFESRIRVYQPYTQHLAISFSLILGILLSGIMLLGCISTHKDISEYYPQILLNLFLNTTLFYILFIYNFFIAKKPLLFYQQYIWEICGTILLTIIYMRLSLLLWGWLYDKGTVLRMENIQLIKELASAIIVLLINYILTNVTKHQQINLEKEIILNESLTIRYNALMSKLDPHFLFNSLNTLNGLIENNDKAQRYVEQLADVYRFTISDKKVVTLKDELKFTNAYITLMQIRYNNNINIEYNIDPNFLSYDILPISIQLLVENAIKHNTISDKEPLKITISSTPLNSIIISNNINPVIEKAASLGLGLTNLSERYFLLDYTINININNYLFNVEIPLLNHLNVQKISKAINQ